MILATSYRFVFFLGMLIAEDPHIWHRGQDPPNQLLASGRLQPQLDTAIGSRSRIQATHASTLFNIPDK